MKKIISSISGEVASPIGMVAPNVVGGKGVDNREKDTLKVEKEDLQNGM